ncbi:MAG: hypothetical protein HY846_08155 [Nitrosomonadales bacterium]|nr:hypothetical protein [Nitrosomonadales bacterium]
MVNLNVGKDWSPVCSASLYEIPTDYVVIRMENKKTKEHAYYDVEKGKFLTQQEAFDVLNGYRR